MLYQHQRHIGVVSIWEFDKHQAELSKGEKREMGVYVCFLGTANRPRKSMQTKAKMREII